MQPNTTPPPIDPYATPTSPGHSAGHPSGMAPPVPPHMPSQKKECGMATASLVLGAMAVTFLFIPFFLSIPAIICGHKARGIIQQAPPETYSNAGAALAGIIMGYIMTVLWALFTLVIVAAVAFTK